VDSDGLQKFWDDYQPTGGLISGIGDQYGEIDNRDKPTIVCWNDPRKTNKYGTFYEYVWNDCEWNLAAIPRRLFLPLVVWMRSLAPWATAAINFKLAKG
jgi:hypothetical protein